MLHVYTASSSNDTMEFMASISVVFRFWQLICITPIGIDPQLKPTTRNVYRTYSFILIAIHVLVIIISLIYGNDLLHPDSTPSVKVVDRFTLLLTQLCCLVVFFESYIKRIMQINLLQKIRSIDFILEYRIGLKLHHIDQKWDNINRLFRLLMLNTTVGIMLGVTSYILYGQIYIYIYRWWLCFYPSLFIYSMRCYQITTYVNLIRHRYHLINRFFKKLQVQKEQSGNINIDLAKTLDNVCTIIQKHKSKSVHKRLSDLRRVCRLLNSVNRNINDLFKWSIPFIVFCDFVAILDNTYWTLSLFFENNSHWHYLIYPSFWIALNFGHVIMLCSVCHHATEEVWNLVIICTSQGSIRLIFFIQANNVSCHLHGLDLNGRDPILRVTV